jgi:20S proteasome alpha/beta subunit
MTFLLNWKQSHTLRDERVNIPRPKPPFVQPNPKRLPQRKAMTIAAGFICNDGVVLCADTQETISGYIKTYDGKVSTSVYKNLVICVAGTGESDYIKTATQQLTCDFPECKTFSEVQLTMEERLSNFFNKNISPWSVFTQHERPSVELLIGMSGVNMGHHLFHYSGTSFRRTDSKAIGAGVLLATDLINRHSHGNYSLEELTSLAVYILSKAKQGVDGCGGHTHVMALRKNRDFAFTEDRDVENMEKSFAIIEKETDTALVKKIMETKLPFSWHNEYRKKTKR